MSLGQKLPRVSHVEEPPSDKHSPRFLEPNFAVRQVSGGTPATNGHSEEVREHRYSAHQLLDQYLPRHLRRPPRPPGRPGLEGAWHPEASASHSRAGEAAAQPVAPAWPSEDDEVYGFPITPWPGGDNLLAEW